MPQDLILVNGNRKTPFKILSHVQVLAGHNGIEMTRRYAETRPDSLREAIRHVFDNK